MFVHLISFIDLFIAVFALPAEANNVTFVKSLAVDAIGRPRSQVVRSERQHPAAVQRHDDPGMELHPAALGEMGSSSISERSGDAIGAHVAAALKLVSQDAARSTLQSKGRASDDPLAPTLSVTGKVYLRQPAEHQGTYKTREWFCDACHLVAGKGKYGGIHNGCYTVEDFTCDGGENCLMDGSSCYFGRVELPKGIQVTYYSGFTGDPKSGAWDNACVGRTERGTASDANWPELKGIVPGAVCAMKFELMSGYTCESSSGENDWKICGTEGHPPGSHATSCSSTILAAAVVFLAFFQG